MQHRRCPASGLAFAFLVLGLSSMSPCDAQPADAEAKEKVLRREIEKALGKTPKGYFLVARRELTSAPGDPVELTATLHVHDGRDAAVDALFEYLKGDITGRKGFRLVQRFDPTPIGEEACGMFREALDKSLRDVKLPSRLNIGTAVIRKSESDAVQTGPQGVQITIVRQLPKIKKTMKVVMALP